MFEVNAARKSFTTRDGVDLSYLEAGNGQPFLMILGWSQTAGSWYNQVNHFSQNYRVLALDMRGHGETSKPEHGYRIYRLSKDIQEFMEALDLTDANLMGHSMGCSILWGLFDLFGADRVSKFVFVDGTPRKTSPNQLIWEGFSRCPSAFPCVDDCPWLARIASSNT